MIITLGLWQIVGLMLLTLIVAGTLKRLGTLTVMVLLGSWSKERLSVTGLSELSLLKSDFDEKASNTAIYGSATPWEGYKTDDFAMGYSSAQLIDKARSGEVLTAGELEVFSGSTGSTTSGVAYVPAAAVLRSKASPVYRGKRWSRKK